MINQSGRFPYFDSPLSPSQGPGATPPKIPSQKGKITESTTPPLEKLSQDFATDKNPSITKNTILQEPPPVSSKVLKAMASYKQKSTKGIIDPKCTTTMILAP